MSDRSVEKTYIYIYCMALEPHTAATTRVNNPRIEDRSVLEIEMEFEDPPNTQPSATGVVPGLVPAAAAGANGAGGTAGGDDANDGEPAAVRRKIEMHSEFRMKMLLEKTKLPPEVYSRVKNKYINLQMALNSKAQGIARMKKLKEEVSKLVELRAPNGVPEFNMKRGGKCWDRAYAGPRTGR